MIISKIETIRVGQFPDLIFVQVHTDTGLIGLGETWYAASTVESAIHDHFGPLLIGRDPAEIERHWQTMFRVRRGRTQSNIGPRRGPLGHQGSDATDADF